MSILHLNTEWSNQYKLAIELLSSYLLPKVVNFVVLKHFAEKYPNPDFESNSILLKLASSLLKYMIYVLNEIQRCKPNVSKI